MKQNWTEIERRVVCQSRIFDLTFFFKFVKFPGPMLVMSACPLWLAIFVKEMLTFLVVLGKTRLVMRKIMGTY